MAEQLNKLGHLYRQKAAVPYYTRTSLYKQSLPPRAYECFGLERYCRFFCFPPHNILLKVGIYALYVHCFLLKSFANTGSINNGFDL